VTNRELFIVLVCVVCLVLAGALILAARLGAS
jgi:hypothetical protein